MQSIAWSNLLINMFEVPRIKRLEQLPPGWANVDVSIRLADGRELHRIEILDLYTNTFYKREDLVVTAIKCFLLLFGNPFYFFFYSVIQFSRIFTVPIGNNEPLLIIKEIEHAIKIPFYFIGMQFAALYGIFQPLEGRALFASIESRLHGGKGRKEAEQHKEREREFADAFDEAVFAKEPRTAFFLAFCMQPVNRERQISRYEILRSFPAV